jgi:regulator of protease activity HflC (stomatin/prohibitin superfamily)
VFVIKTINVVPQQHAWVVERLGKYHATLAPGLNIVVPFVDRIAYKHSLKEIPLDVPPQVCITKDNTQLQVDGILYFQVTDAMRASYGASNYIQAITQLAQTTLRSVIGKMELDKTFEERDHINTTIVNAIDESAANWGVKVLRYEIKDLTPPAEILHSMQRQITAEREKRALIAASEGRRQEADQHRQRRTRSGHRPVGRREAGRDQPRTGRGRGHRRAGRCQRQRAAPGGRGDPQPGGIRRRQPARGRRVRRRVRQAGQDQQLDHRAGRPGRHERPDRVSALTIVKSQKV